MVYNEEIFTNTFEEVGRMFGASLSNKSISFPWPKDKIQQHVTINPKELSIKQKRGRKVIAENRILYSDICKAGFLKYPDRTMFFVNSSVSCAGGVSLPLISNEHIEKINGLLILGKKEPRHFEVYTDGGCLQHKSFLGAWCFIITENGKVIEQCCETEPRTSNNRMELRAAEMAIKALKKYNIESATIYSDSQYLINGKNDWISGWYDFEGKIDTDRKNGDLWQRIVDADSEASCKLDYKWIKGHNGNKFNELCDSICTTMLARGDC